MTIEGRARGTSWGAASTAVIVDLKPGVGRQLIVAPSCVGYVQVCPTGAPDKGATVAEMENAAQLPAVDSGWAQKKISGRTVTEIAK